MPAWSRTYVTTTIVNALPANANETIVGQVLITNPTADGIVILDAWGKLTTGVATTSIVPRLRRDGVAGTVVGDANLITIIGAVGSTGEYGHRAVDRPGDVAQQLYVFTYVQTAATGAGTLLAVFVRATVQ